jgi:hypothetical protein
MTERLAAPRRSVVIASPEPRHEQQRRRIRRPADGTASG